MSEEICIGPNSCFECGGEYGEHSDDCSRSRSNRVGTWRIEYEIPPLRAIYFCAIDNATEAQARELVAKEQPLWRIRKITPE